MSEQELEEFLAEETQTEDEQAQLSRRKFLTGAVAGGAAGLALATGTGVAVWKVSDAELVAAKGKAEAELSASQETAVAELARMQGLVDLYEGLEKIGLDAVLKTGMTAVALPLEGVEAGRQGAQGRAGPGRGGAAVRRGGCADCAGVDPVAGGPGRRRWPTASQRWRRRWAGRWTRPPTTRSPRPG